MSELLKFFISYSLNAVNQGCINVEASTEREAIANVITLGIEPKFDDIRVYIVEENDLPLNTLVSREDLIKQNFEKTPDSIGANR